MQSYMGWDLVCRTKEQLADLSSEIAPDAVLQTKMFVEPHGHIMFLELVKG